MSKPHLLALKNKSEIDYDVNSDEDIVSNNLTYTLASKLYHSNPSIKFRSENTKGCTRCVAHNNKLSLCRICKAKRVPGACSSRCVKHYVELRFCRRCMDDLVQGAGSSLCVEKPLRRKIYCIDCLSLEEAVQRKLICRICLVQRTQNYICKECCGRFTGTPQGRLESFVLECIYKAFPGTNFEQGKTLGLQIHCKNRVPGNVSVPEKVNAKIRAKTFRPDFVITSGLIYLFVEVDVYGHQGYNVLCELARLDNMQHGLNNLDKGSNERTNWPNILIRFNPHNNKDFQEPLEERISFLLALMESLLYGNEAVTEGDLTNLSNALHIYYMYYNLDNVHYQAAKENSIENDTEENDADDDEDFMY